MSSAVSEGLARREREVMDLLFREKEATARRLHELMEDAPSYSAVRALLATLAQKGQVVHRKEGRQYVYRAAVAREEAKKSALRRLLGTFFEGRPEKLVESLLDPEDQELDEQEIAKIKALLEERGVK